MVAIHIEHKLDAGVLTIARVRINNPPGMCDGPLYGPGSRPPHETDSLWLAEVIQFRFECGATGAWFDADVGRDEISKMCAILGEDDELAETLNTPPSVSVSTPGQNDITVTFMVTGRKKSYPVPVVMTRRTYAADKQDIMELRAENAVLRRKIVSLEEFMLRQSDDISFLAQLVLKYISSRGHIEQCKGLERLIKNIDSPINISTGWYDASLDVLYDIIQAFPVEHLLDTWGKSILPNLIENIKNPLVSKCVYAFIEKISDKHRAIVDDKSLITVINNIIKEENNHLDRHKILQTTMRGQADYSTHIDENVCKIQLLTDLRTHCIKLGFS